MTASDKDLLYWFEKIEFVECKLIKVENILRIRNELVDKLSQTEKKCFIVSYTLVIAEKNMNMKYIQRTRIYHLLDCVPKKWETLMKSFKL
jgi:hypothetical protein